MLVRLLIHTVTQFLSVCSVLGTLWGHRDQGGRDVGERRPRACQPPLTGGDGGGCCGVSFVPLTLCTCRLACSPWQPLTDGPAFICLSTNGRCVWQTCILGSLRAVVQGRRKPTGCLGPGYSSSACARFGKNRWRMLTTRDLERKSSTCHQLEGREGGRAQTGCLCSLFQNGLTAEATPQNFKDSPLLAKFRAPL